MGIEGAIMQAVLKDDKVITVTASASDLDLLAFICSTTDNMDDIIMEMTHEEAAEIGRFVHALKAKNPDPIVFEMNQSQWFGVYDIVAAAVDDPLDAHMEKYTDIFKLFESIKSLGDLFKKRA